jgi:uncharacterized membrane protein YeaQ/YmgE (transglycosylase-associated protein family)
VPEPRRQEKWSKIISLLIFLAIGLITGALVSYITGRQQDLLINLLIGLVGAVTGGLLARLPRLGTYGEIGEVVTATLGAIICILVWQRIR